MVCKQMERSNRTGDDTKQAQPLPGSVGTRQIPCINAVRHCAKITTTFVAQTRKLLSDTRGRKPCLCKIGWNIPIIALFNSIYKIFQRKL